MPVGMNRYWQTEGSMSESKKMNDKINVKTEGNKILFYRNNDDDWFFGCRIESKDDVQSVIKRQGFNPWFTTQLQNEFYDICKNLISEN